MSSTQDWSKGTHSLVPTRFSPRFIHSYTRLVSLANSRHSIEIVSLLPPLSYMQNSRSVSIPSRVLLAVARNGDSRILWYNCHIKMSMVIMYDDGLFIVFCAVVHRPSSMCMYIVASKWVYTRWCLKRQLIKVSVISTQHWIIRRVRGISISRYNMKSFPSDNNYFR